MIAHAFRNAIATYSMQESNWVFVHETDHELFEMFCRSLHRFRSTLKEDAYEDTWRYFLSALYRYRNLCLTGLLSFRDQSERIDIELLESLVKRSAVQFQQYHEDARRIYGIFEQLSNLDDNPLWEKLLELRLRTKLDIFISSSYGRDVVEYNVQNQVEWEDARLVTTAGAKAAYGRLALVLTGPPYRYPDWFFTSSRYPQVHVLSYSWMNNRVTFDNDMIKSIVHPSADKRKVIINRSQIKKEIPNAASVTIDRDEWEPPAFDSSHLIQKIVRVSSSSSTAWERVKARLYRLPNNKVVLLEHGAGSWSLILSFNDIGEVEVERSYNKNLASGMYLLHRTGKDRDYLLQLSRQILGEDADHCFACLSEWKELLQKKLSEYGAKRVAKNLKEHGAKYANEINLRHWASDYNIGLRKKEEFRVLLTFLKLDDVVDEYWDASRRIGIARIKAGQRIRKNLLAVVEHTDLSDLELDGEFSFQLQDDVGGSLTAFRIEGVSSETLDVSNKFTRIIFESERIFQEEGVLT